MTNKSDTPHCDENIVVSVYGEVRVPLEFARQLERELNALKAENERLQAFWDYAQMYFSYEYKARGGK